ncbi:MAG: caspase family protein [Bacteroidales bacterium]|nr:caspase family protein [Bacteroidales bacterium]
MRYKLHFMRLLVLLAMGLGSSLLAQEQSETTVNNEYREIIMQYLRKDVASRQKAMESRAQKLLLGLPNEDKLYDESEVHITARVADGVTDENKPELNFVVTITYNCRNIEGASDDFAEGEYLIEHSNSAKALCKIAQDVVERECEDLFAAGKRVTVRISGSTDAKAISHIDYGGEYGEFRYCPARFNNENVRISVSSEEGISTNAQLAYVRAQGIKDCLQKNLSLLSRTENDYKFVTRCYEEVGAQYRRSGIELTVHAAFDEMIVTMNEKLINDEFIEYNIPENPTTNDHTFVLIIANEEYEAPLPNCDYAWRDGAVVQEYCTKTLGIPERHVKVLNNASADMIQRKGIKWLKDILTAKKGDANLLVYYSGHGVSDADYHPYIVPCGMNLKSIRSWAGKAEINTADQLSKKDTKTLLSQCLSLDTLIGWFSRVTANNVTFIVDAGFNDSQRSGDLLVNMKKNVDGKPSKGMRLRNDIVIFHAANFRKTAYSFDDQKHGFLTYFLMKELKRTKGDINYGDLWTIIGRELSYESSLQGKLQEPEMIAGGKLKDTWATLRFKP